MEMDGGLCGNGWRVVWEWIKGCMRMDGGLYGNEWMDGDRMHGRNSKLNPFIKTLNSENPWEAEIYV